MSSEEVRVRVRTAAAYDVVIGRGLAGRLPELLGNARRVAVIHPARLGVAVSACRDSIAAAGYEPCPIPVPDAERAKTADFAASCWSWRGRCGFTRSDAVCCIRGGATTQLGGFVAVN